MYQKGFNRTPISRTHFKHEQRGKKAMVETHWDTVIPGTKNGFRNQQF